MRRLVMWNLMTLDGFFEGAQPWDLDWHDRAWGEELERFSIEQLDAAAMLLFGRRTYEGRAAYWPTASGDSGESGEVADRMNAISKVVFSRTLATADWPNTRIVREDAVSVVGSLKREGDGDMFVFGSAELSTSLRRAGLFDEYRICLAPVILGTGAALFGRDVPERPLRLIESRPLQSGGVILRYEPSHD